MIKYIFSDLDQTLLSNDKKIPKRNIEAINKAQEKGVKFFFNTGRLPFSFEEFKNDVDLSSYVSCNGGIIKLDGKTIYEKYLDKKEALMLLNIAVREDIYARVFTSDWLYEYNKEKDNANSISYDRSCRTDLKETLKILDRLNIFKINYHLADEEKLKAIQKEINSSGLDVQAVFSGTYYLECFPKGNSKGEAIKKLCEITGVDIKDTIAAGDADNDISMLKVAGISACPVNASDKIKSLSKYIAESDNNDGAIGEIIEKFI